MSIMQIYSNFMILTGIIYVFMFMYSSRKKNNPLITIFSLICLASAVYIFGAAFQFNADNLDQILFGQKLKYFGGPFVFAAWLIFTYRIHFKKDMTFAGKIMTFIIPAVTVFLVATNEYHRLFYSNLKIFQYEGFLLSRRSTGILYYPNVIYAYFVIFFGLYAFFVAWSKSGYKLNNPYFMLLMGRLLSGILVGVYLLGKTPKWIDLLPFSSFTMVIASAMAIFYYHIFDTKEIYDKKIFSEIKEGLILIDDNNLLIDYNEAAQGVFAWLTEENKGKPVSMFHMGEKIVNNKQSKFILTVTNDWKNKYYEFRITDLLTDKNKLAGRVFIFLDITDKQHMIDELNYMVEHDWLTNVYNRRKILEEAEHIIPMFRKSGKNVSMIMMDIDNFKKINDSYGHIAGDNVLRGVIDSSRQVMRKDGLIGRYGGEEFLIVLPGADACQAIEEADKIRSNIESTVFTFDEKKINVTVSLGISSASMDVDSTVSDLINMADKALYKAKSEGRNRTCVFDNDNAAFINNSCLM